jgi:hypothetical protein
MNTEYVTVGGIKLREENEVVYGNIPKYHFLQHKSHITCTTFEAGPR